MQDERGARARRAYAAASQQPLEAGPLVRVGDAERQAVVVALQGHFVAGRLDSDELSERLEQALAARTASQLRVPLRDLPLLAAPVGVARARIGWARMPSLVLGAMVALLLLSWLIWLPSLRLF